MAEKTPDGHHPSPILALALKRAIDADPEWQAWLDAVCSKPSALWERRGFTIVDYDEKGAK